MRSFQQLNAERGITILLVTHEPDIAAYSKRLMRLKDGHVLYDGPAAEGLREMALSQEVALGHPTHPPVATTSVAAP
jgi:putative ABC transport system ATP-binding protein